MAAGVHVFSAAVRKKERTFFCLEELFFLQAVFHGDMDEVFDDGDGVGDRQPGVFVDVEFVDEVSCHGCEFLVDFIGFRDLRDVFEEGMGEF